MVEEQLIKRGISNVAILDAMLRVPRHHFVEPRLAREAYIDSPLSLPCDQTISQPYMVAKMCELLDLKGDEKILEIGAGSGYQAAILGCLARAVIGIELHATLANMAFMTLEKLGFVNVKIVNGDGRQGYISESPFDRILLSCASTYIEEAWKNQLYSAGILVLPLGATKEKQRVHKLVKGTDGWLRREILFPVRYVTLI